MKVMWLGVRLGPKTETILTKNGGQVRSAQISEKNLLDGLKAMDLDIDTISGPQLPSSVFDVVDEEVWSDEISSKNISVGYRNISFINRLFKEKAIILKAKEWAKQNRNEKDVVVFVYAMHTPFMSAAAEIKKIIPNAKIAMIVMDLPQYMDLKGGKLKNILKHLDWIRIRKLMRYVDKYILYAKPMAEYLSLDDGKWVVMEGSYDSDQVGVRCTESEKITVMYSGVLDLRYGIPELLDAFKLLDDRFELWLTGDGNARELIEQRAAQDNRIKYYGFFPVRQDLLNKQASATMLISPRREVEKASRYCFPSKLFEYLVSGNPVISCYLDGIPEEYREYLVELDGVTADNIAKSVLRVAGMSEEQRKNIGLRAKCFILSKKNKYAQVEKMWRFVNS